MSFLSLKEIKKTQQQNDQLCFSSALCILPKIESKTVKYRGKNKFEKLKNIKLLTKHLTG
jgi:hypothetical protein